MDGTILSQGTFVASSLNLANPNPGNATVGQANAAYIAIPSNADFMWVKNFTQSGTAGNSGSYVAGANTAFTGVEYYWQRGMPIGSGLVKYHANTTAVVNDDVFQSTGAAPWTYAGGFTLFDPSGQTQNALPLLGSPVAATSISNATQPVVTGSNTTGLSVGSVVRFYFAPGDTALAYNITGIDFVVGAINSGTSFTVLAASNAFAANPNFTTGSIHWRLVNYSPLFYPRARTITKITQAANAVVSTSIAHGLTAGQEIRFNIPSVSGMTQLNYNASFNTNAASIVSVIDDYSFTINVDTTGYTPFTYPTQGQQPSSFPELSPVGEDTATSLLVGGNQTPSVGMVQIYNTNTGILADSTVNTGYLGMILGNGGNGRIANGNIQGPAGSIAWTAGNVPTGDIMYWVVGKSSLGGL